MRWGFGTRIKKFFFALFLTLVLFTVLVVFSVIGENDYVKNCADLGLNCEEGRVQHFLKLAKAWLAKYLQH